MTEKHINIRGIVIYNYRVTDSRIEFCYPGGSVSITNPAEISIVSRWIRQAKQFAKNSSEVCSYLEYMLDYGQYE